MIRMAAALYAEALPFIRALELERRQEPSCFPVFSSGTHRLILTGTGSLSAAVADTFLLAADRTDGEKADTDIFVQLGVCAAPSSVPYGRLFLCHKITDAATGRSVYPDMLYRSDFAECPVTTFPLPRTRMEHDTGLADMEAYGGFHAAAAFLPPHRIFTLKIVSDHGTEESEPLSASDLSALITPHVDPVLSWLDRIQAAARAENAPALPDPDLSALPFRLSVTELLRLKQLLRYATLNGQSADSLLAAYRTTEIHPAQRKTEGKRFYHELEQRILP